MRRVAFVSDDIFQHRVYRSRKRRQLGEAGKHCPITNFTVDHKGGPLRDFQRVKFGRARSHSCLDRRRTRAFEQFHLIESACLRADVGRHLPFVGSLSVAQDGGGQCQPDAIICHSELSGCLRNEIPHRIFRHTRLKPFRV